MSRIRRGTDSSDRIGCLSRAKYSDALQKAKQYAYLLLKQGQRSVQEVTQRLQDKKFASSVIQEVISFLKEERFLDDHALAWEWMESRLKKSFGLTRIIQELTLRGVDPKIIENCCLKLSVVYPEEKQVARVMRSKFKLYKSQDREKTRRRLYAYCLRRGFSGDIIAEELDKVLSRAEEE